MAEMLGARRPTVSVAAHTLASAGLIKYHRGRIEIVNGEGLRDASCECYATLHRLYERLYD
jgi:Mn-dependent DtxR family transcriptional regulator